MRGRYGSYLKGLPQVREIFFKVLMTLDNMDALLNMFERIESHYAGFQPERVHVNLVNYHQHLEKTM